MTLKLVWLYARDMNIYGDYGNILAIKKQLELSGIDYELVEYNPGNKFPMNADIIVGGGGQDSGQSKIKHDLAKIGPKLKKLADEGVPMLMICGLYQLFGDYFQTIGGEKIAGIGVFRGLKTYGGQARMIGNILTESKDFGEIIGYENHSGQTVLPSRISPLGKVTQGAGNNPEGKTEGARYKNVIGTYMHGSVLPKNPRISDFLIKQALQNKSLAMPKISVKNKAELAKLDRITEKARQLAKKRPR